MTTLLFAVGIVVFFLTVYGAVMVGGHLLAEAEITETSITPARVRAEDAEVRAELRGVGAPSSPTPADDRRSVA